MESEFDHNRLISAYISILEESSDVPDGSEELDPYQVLLQIQKEDEELFQKVIGVLIGDSMHSLYNTLQELNPKILKKVNTFVKREDVDTQILNDDLMDKEKVSIYNVAEGNSLIDTYEITNINKSDDYVYMEASNENNYIIITYNNRIKEIKTNNESYKIKSIPYKDMDGNYIIMV